MEKSPALAMEFTLALRLGSAIRDYNAGKTTQVPAVFSVRLKSRFRGSIRAEGRKLIFEGGINAR